MVMNRFNIKKTTFYRYRTAMVTDIIISLDRNSEDGKRIEDKLYALTPDAQPDNHVVFEVITSSGGKLCIMISDFNISIGTAMEVKRW